MTTNTHHRLTPPDTSLKSIAKLAGPIFVANIAIVGGGTIDTIMAGHLGAEHLAAIALGLASMIMVFMGLVGILQGMSPLAAHHYGARQYEKIGFELSQCLWLALFLALIGMPILGSTEIWTTLAEAQGEVKRMASQYLLISMIGLPAALAGRAFISLNAAVSRPKVTMYVSLAMLIFKVPLNAVFMYGWLGFEAMGGAGAAISSTILTYISCLVYLTVWKRDPFYRQMRCAHFYWPQPKALWAQLKIGIPIGLSTFFEISSFTLMAIFVSRFGAVTVSAHQIVANITSMVYMLQLAIGISCTVLVAQCIGAGWTSVGEKTVHRCLVLSAVTATMSALILYFGRDIILHWYTSDEGVVKIAASLILFGVCYHIFDALQCVSAFSLRAYRVTFWPMIIYGVLLWGIGIIGGYYMAFNASPFFDEPLKAYGFWGMITLGLFLAGAVLTVFALWVARIRSQEDRHISHAHIQ